MEVPKRGKEEGVEVAGAVRGGRSYLLDSDIVADGGPAEGGRVKGTGAALEEKIDVTEVVDVGIGLMFIFCGGAHCYIRVSCAKKSLGVKPTSTCEGPPVPFTKSA